MRGILSLDPARKGRHERRRFRPVAGKWKSALNVFLIVYAVIVGAAAGLYSAFWMVEGEYPFGRRQAQAWNAWPQLGSREIDPYARAMLARSGDIPLGAGEGLSFHAFVDDEGRPLDNACTYVLEGVTPPARYWTLTLYDARGRVRTGPTARSSLTSAQILRDESGQMKITLSARPQPGNWLIVPETDRFQIALRLYDTPVSGTLSWLTPGSLPTIIREDCSG